MNIKLLNDDKIIKQYLPIIAYREYIKNGVWCVGYNEQNEVCCILPFEIRKKLFFTYLVSVNETIIIKEGDKEKEFLNDLVKVLKDKYDFIAQPNTNCVFNIYPDDAIIAPFGSYIIDLIQDEETLWKNIHSKHKNVIRRAIKKGVKIKIGFEYFNEVYDVILYTLKSNNIFIESKEILKNKILSLKDNFIIVGSYYNDQIQTGAIIPFNKYKGYYIYGGSINNPLLGSNNLLQWEVLKILKSLEVQKYDFVGARIKPKTEKLKGIQRFKSRFGATLKQGYLWKYPLNPIKFYLFEILYRLKNKKGDIIEQEKNSINI